MRGTVLAGLAAFLMVFSPAQAGGEREQCPRPDSQYVQLAALILDRDADCVCGTKTKCGQMDSCAEARCFLEKCGVTRLDGDGDGTPCESICG